MSSRRPGWMKLKSLGAIHLLSFPLLPQGCLAPKGVQPPHVLPVLRKDRVSLAGRLASNGSRHGGFAQRETPANHRGLANGSAVTKHVEALANLLYLIRIAGPETSPIYLDLADMEMKKLIAVLLERDIPIR